MSARLSDNDLSTLDAAALRDYLRHFVDAGDTATAAFAGKLFADVDTQNDNRSYHAFCAGLRSGMREASREK